jgi:beta-glucosidase
MTTVIRARRTSRRHFARVLVAVAVMATALTVGIPAATSSPLPYTLQSSSPAPLASPSVDALAPYTPAVLSLIAQLEPTPGAPTLAQIQNAGRLVHDGTSSSCHNVGPVNAPTGLDATGVPVAGTNTSPAIPPICWTDAQGVLNTSGPNTRGSTGPMTLMGLAASFDRSLGNAWGQTEGAESRAFMVTGMFGPQTDLDRIPNWGRNLTTTGEDPYLSYEMVSAQIQGMQGAGAMSEMKHFVVYNGQNQNANTDIQDQPLHELYMTPYEGGFVNAEAAATMCSYQIWRDTSTSPLLNATSTALASGPSPFTGIGPDPATDPQTWKLNESHFSCEQPLSQNYTLRGLWGSKAFIGSDYPATHSTSGMLQGEDQEMPTANGFFAGGNGTNDPTGSTCAYYTGNPGGFTPGTWDPGCTSSSSRVGGIPNGFQGGNAAAACAAPATATAAGGCTLNAAVVGGVVPLSVFNQSLARVLYQLERFKMLGCYNPPATDRADHPEQETCANPGGVALDTGGRDRSGLAPLPLGATGQLGTKLGDAAVVEKYSEEGATLLKNDGNALPLTCADLAGGILITGSSANHTVADPTNEASTGFIDRDAVNPLEQLKEFAGAGPSSSYLNCPSPASNFKFVPANDPTGAPVPASALSADGATTGALNLSVDGAPATVTPGSIDDTTVSSGQLGQHSYTWTGYVYVPTADAYTFDFQQSASVPNANVTFALGATAGTPSSPATARTLATAPVIYGATVPGSPTNAGYTEPLLTNRQFSAGTLNGGYYPITITFNNSAGTGPASFRFAFSRTAGDLADAAAAAAAASKAVVFVNTGTGASSSAASPAGTPYDGHTISAVEALSAANVNLISAVAAANPNTIVVINSDNPIDTAWVGSVKSVLEMWFAGQEGGTSTARLLLGLANPSGHTSLTWPANRTDTIWGYNEPANGLYPGSTAGQHLERLNNNGGCGGTGNPGSLACPAAGATTESEGIFTGYRYFDQLGITPRFAFGFGLSYSDFSFPDSWGAPSVTPTADGGLDVRVKIRNGSATPGADVVQVYVGAPSNPVPGVQYAPRSLAQFDRVQVPAKTAGWPFTVVKLHVAPRAFAHWSENDQRWVRDSGPRTIYVGDADMPSHLLSTTVDVPAVPAAGAFECANANINATRIVGDVNVPAGSWCDLTAVTVTGRVVVHNGSTGVRILNSTIGSLLSSGAATAGDPHSFGVNVVCNTTITGTLDVLQSSGGAAWNIGSCGGNTISGDASIASNASSVVFSNNTVTSGDLKVTGNTGAVASYVVSHNTVSGVLWVKNNSGVGTVTYNTSGGARTCTGNNPAPTSHDNSGPLFPPASNPAQQCAS